MPEIQLDEQIFLESPINTNVSGELTTTWADESGESPPVNDWARIISQKGSESFEAARTNSNAFIRIQMNYREDVKGTWRVLWEGDYYNITHIDRTERLKGYLWLTAELSGGE